MAVKELSRTEQRELAQALLLRLGETADRAERPLRFMEVCGTHTVAIFRGGIRQMLSSVTERVELVSGPGCPVCVTPDSYMDKAIAYAGREDVIIATFGDMLKVPGSESSLSAAQAEGADIRIVYSPLDSLAVARENPGKKVVFLAVGFETTAPTAAATVLAARQEGLDNLFLLSAQKLVPPVMRALIADPEVRVDGFILPGHVAVVTGSEAFAFLARDYRLPGVVTGFGPLQILRAIYRLVVLAATGEAQVENEYGSVVRAEGNPRAQRAVAEVYEEAEAEWRGLGNIPFSGLRMREVYADYDIEQVMPLPAASLPPPKKTGCRCGEVLRGLVTPRECPLFGKACVPTHAVGPCMVSVEGVCAAWHKYGKGTFSYGAE